MYWIISQRIRNLLSTYGDPSWRPIDRTSIRAAEEKQL
jgi:hypothetical protein